MDKDLIRNRHIPDDVEIVERNGYIFLAHPRMRFDPIVSAPLLTKLAVGTMVAGTAAGVAGTLQEGKQAEKIAKQRAAVDIESAKATRRASVEEAGIKQERGRRFLETQKGAAAAGGIRIM